MSKTRILGGFSLVEMMLLLLITSLMLASSVTLITKKHVKVPKITMHGAYMCYMKNGRLHEEQYVGAGLRKKTKDQDVDRCSFKPPARTSYLHIQAIGGGGGGGDSGYTGGDLQTFESATEVISPFGITQGLLDLKGISGAELSTLGGNLYAYAMAEDAGRGGDLYYITQDCKNTCLQWRTWEYKGTQEVDCYCNQKTDYYTVYHKNYDLWDDCANSCYVPCTHTCYDTCWKTCYDSCPIKETVNCYWYDSSCSHYVGGTCTGPNGETFNPCGTKQVTTGWRDCNPYSCSYSCNPHKCHSSDYVTSASQCGTHVCNRTTGSCQSYSRPTSSFADTYSSLNVYADDRYTEDWRDPKHMYESVAATGTATLKVRDVKRDEQIAKAICNYGNTTKFTGVSDGVFGTFADGEVPVGCNTEAIMAAFGDDIHPLGGGNTVFTRITTKSSANVYGGGGIKYDTSEENTNAYGQRCVNDAQNGTCNKYEYKYNVPGVYKSLITGYKVSYGTDNYNGCPNASSYDHGSVNTSYTSTSSTSNYGNGSSYCSCPRRNSSGTECVSSKNLCSYIPAKVTGGNAGKGTKCRTNNIQAGIGINYVGNSSVIPGVRGSDKNCTGAGYKALYTEGEWRSQPSCYAENGTNAVGSSTVRMGSNTCTANAVAPTLGKGARKTSTGTAGGTNGANSTQNGTTTGNGYTTAGGCGNEHVGYCLTRKGGGTNENGKYTYKYTWDTNFLQFGEGGKAGQYRAMIIRSFDGIELPITLGQGGAGGAPETGNAGEDGTTTVVGDVVRAEGGTGGPGGIHTPVEQLPTWYSGGAFVKGKNGTQGESANIANFKANILNLILPVDNSVLGQWLAASGAGGDGGGSRNNCWASEWVRWFEGTEVYGKERVHAEDITCRNGKYWAAEPNATSGTAGAVLIRW